MTWKKAVLRPAAMDVTCSLVCLHPWSEKIGNATHSGSYLSPVNAIYSLSPYLKDSTEKDVVALLLCAPSTNEFLSLAQQFSGAFSLPEIGRMCRMISSQLSLAISKMQIPARPATMLPPPAIMSTQITRNMTRAAIIAQAGEPSSVSLEALSSSLSKFRMTRKAALQEIAQQQAQLQQNTCPVWCFNHSGELRMAATLMQKNIPHPEWVFATVILFVGDNLSSLREALHDPDDCPCA